MVSFISITDKNHPLFEASWLCYDAAFPPEEKRNYEKHSLLFTIPEYHLEGVLSEGNLIGFITWWKLGEWIYIEHFATNELVRGKGFGQKILEKFLSGHTGKIVLEVELPEDDLSHRRIAFYERMGFHLNRHPYTQPPLQEGLPEIPLFTMTFPDPVSLSEQEEFIRQHHPTIYFNAALK